jgi:hypothetical protein
MTEAYGISFLNAKKEFLNFNQKSYLDQEKLKELETTFKSFFIFLEKNPLLFKKSPETIINKFFLKKNFSINLYNGESANIIYFKKKILQKNYYINKKRFTKKELVLTTALDQKKTKRAVRANYVHILESAVAREVAKQCNTPIVHDCFTIDYLNITYLLSLINEIMNIKFHSLGLLNEEDDFIIFSIFIVL